MNTPNETDEIDDPMVSMRQSTYRALEAEVEAMKRDLGEAHAQRMRAIEKNDAAWAEVERLQGIVESYVASGPTNKELFDDAVASHNEVERLRAALETVTDWHDRWEESQAEIERLRGAIADMVRGKEVLRLEAEVERLRGAIQDAIDADVDEETHRNLVRALTGEVTPIQTDP